MIVLQERNVSDYSLLVFNDIKHSFGFCDQIDELFFGKAVRTETGCLYSHNPVQVCPGCLDMKMVNDRAMVIEINDNPSIDHGIEDAVLGDDLYYRILNHFGRMLPYNTCRQTTAHRSGYRSASRTQSE